MDLNLKYREYGVCIFYNKDDGKIIYKEPEIAGRICEQYRENSESISKKFNIPIGQIVKNEYAYNSLLDNPNHRILLMNKQSGEPIYTEDGGYFTFCYLDQKEQRTYSLEKINEFYNVHYMFNVAQIIDEPTIKVKWLGLDEIMLRNSHLDLSWVNYFVDRYVKDSCNDKMAIAKDIMENGTYWSIVVQDIGKDEYLLWEGNHRVLSSKLLDQNEEWDPNKKYLAWIVNQPLDELKDARNGHIILDRPKRVRAPYIAKFPDYGYPNDGNREEIKKIMKDRDMIFVDDDEEVVEYTVYSFSELLCATQIFPHWLRDIFYNYKHESTESIRSNIIMNDEKAWKEFVDVVRGFS